MTTQNVTARTGFVEMRTETAQAKAGLPDIRNVLFVEDEDSDARRLAAILRIVFGRDVNAVRAEKLGEVAAAVLNVLPDVVFIDDYLKPDDTALDTIPVLRQAGYAGPVIVMSGELDRARSLQLAAAGASVTMHKEDINSAAITNAMQRAFDARPA